MFFTNKRFAYGLMCISAMVIVLLYPASGYGQDTVALQDVVISASREELSRIGKKNEVIDSTVKEQFRFGSVGDVLSYNTPVFIKAYGPGALSTSAFRGGSAEQTAFLWNGFNIQNYMLGQTDLNLLPNILFEEIGVEYGGGSSLWGSGAVGGSIHLDTKSPFNKGVTSVVNFGGGSFGQLNASMKVLYSKKRFVSSTKLYVNSAINNFQYRDTLDKEEPVKRMKHSDYHFKGLMQELKFLLSPKHVLSFNVWANDNHRNLPGFNPQAESKTYQDDQALRLTANWGYAAGRFKSNVRTGFFSESVNYADSLAGTFSDSKVETFVADAESYVDWGSSQRFNIGASFLSSTGMTQSYSSAGKMSRISLLAGNKFSFFNQRLKTYVSLRLEYFSAGTLPLTGNVSAEYNLLRDLKASVNVAKIYRQPTLNELYWGNVGNRNLKPEEGYTYEGTLQYTKTSDHVLVSVSGSAYSRSIDNWIYWAPGAGANPVPVNVQKVWSRGTETSWKLQYASGKFRAGIRLASSYVLSTVVSTHLENSDNEGRQLIYTPRYNLNGNVSAGYGSSEIFFFHQYVGYRFTASDNSGWLDPYHVSSVKANYKFIFKKLNIALFAACNNLFNTSYYIVSGRPMPLRYYEAGITIQTK